MPIYLYECGQGEKHRFYKKFPVHSKPEAIPCAECEGIASFRFTPEVQLNTRPLHLSDAWRSHLSATDQLAQDKADAEAYAKSWEPEPVEA